MSLLTPTKRERRPSGQREAFQQKNAEFDQHRTAKMSKVTKTAKAEKARLLNEVREESDALRSRPRTSA